MSFFEEIKQLGDESHEKWFNRYFNEKRLETRIKKAASKGFTGILIDIMSEKDEYLQRRLDDEKTIEMLKKRLGDGFDIRYEFYYSRNIFTKEKYVSNKRLHITW